MLFAGSTGREGRGLVLGLAALALWAGGLRLQAFVEPDTWWHLTDGARIWAHQSVRGPDSGSFTALGQVWVSQSPLTDALLHGLYTAGGGAALTVWSAAMAALHVVLVGMLAARHSTPGGALVVTALVAAATNWRFEPRPQAVFLVCLPLALLWADRWNRRPGALVHGVGLVLFGALWANSHGSFPMLWVVLGLCWVASGRRDRAVARVVLLGVGAGTAVLASPHGLTYFDMLGRVGGGDATRFITEMKPLRWTDLFPRHLNSILWLDALLLVFAVGWGTRRDRWGAAGRWSGAAALLGAVLSFRARRFRAAWAVLVGAGAWLRLPLGVGAAGAGLVMVLGALPIMERGRDRGGQLGTAEHRWPVGAVRAIAHACPECTGAMFHTYAEGGFLRYHLDPKIRIAIDGRTPTLFSDEVYFQHRAAMRDPEAFRRWEDRYGLKLALVPQGAPVCGALSRRSDWRLVHVDARRALFAHESVRWQDPELTAIAGCAPLSGLAANCGPGLDRSLGVLVARGEAFGAALSLQAALGCGAPVDPSAHRSLAAVPVGELQAIWAGALGAAGSPALGLAHARRAMTLDPAPHRWVLIARLAHAAGLHEDAADAYRRALSEMGDGAGSALRLEASRALESIDPVRSFREYQRAKWTHPGG